MFAVVRWNNFFLMSFICGVGSGKVGYYLRSYLLCMLIV